MDKIFQKLKTETPDEYEIRISALMDNDDYDLTWTKVANIINSQTGNDYSADRYRKKYRAYLKDEITTAPNRGETIDEIFADEEEEEFDYTSFNKESVAINYEKNEQTSSREIPLTDEQLRNPAELLKAHNYDPNAWVLKNASNSKTTRRTPNGDSFVYASRITVRPKDAREVTYEDIDNYFATFNGKKYNGIKVTPKQYDADGEFLEVCIQDVHMGLLSYEQETGEDYDVEIAKARLQHCMSDIYQRCKGRKFKRIVLVLLGDIMHVDNIDGTTTKGTRQDVDTRPTRIFDEALSALIEVVENLGSIAPVEVINIQGNHDRLTSYMLAKSLEMSFRGDKNVTFFNGPNPRKWRRYGNVLLGYAHGDMKPNAVSEWLSNECDEWSDAKYREVHLGHLHSLQTIQRIEDNKYGLIARYLPAICASSAWEHEMGYPKSQRGMMSFVWNEDTGLREIWYSNI